MTALEASKDQLWKTAVKLDKKLLTKSYNGIISNNSIMVFSARKTAGVTVTTD